MPDSGGVVPKGRVRGSSPRLQQSDTNPVFPEFVVNQDAEQHVTLRDGRAVRLRDAVPSDAAAMDAYLRAVFPEVRRCVKIEPDEHRPDAVAQRQWLENREPDRGDQVLLALAGDEVVGTLRVIAGRLRKIAHVGDLAMTVRRAWQGVGLGSAMMGMAIERAEACPGLMKLNLEVYSHNEPAIRLYERFGFERAGVLPGEAQIEPGAFVDAVLMYRWVEGATPG